MPRIELVVQVFVASPSDVKEEREILESVILELNKTWSKKLKLRLELNRWESNVYPNFGQDPQDVINRQIEDRYDIFIGILWGRIGTPTQRAESGTLEEFQQAYRQHKENSDSIDLMIYFKETPISPSKIDIEQLSKLKEFRSTLGDQGGLYWTFESLSDFESTIRSHLSLVTQRWADKMIKEYPYLISLSSNEEINVATQDRDAEENIELGLFDYYSILQEQAEQMGSVMGVIGEATIDIGQQIQRRTDGLLTIGNLTGAEAKKEAEKVIKLASDDMNRYSSTLKIQLPKFASSRDDVFESLSKAIMLFGDFESHDEDNYAVLEVQLLELRESIYTVKVGIVNFKQAISALPRISSHFNKAKRTLVDMLANTLKEFDSTLDLILVMEGAISQQRESLIIESKENI